MFLLRPQLEFMTTSSFVVGGSVCVGPGQGGVGDPLYGGGMGTVLARQ